MNTVLLQETVFELRTEVEQWFSTGEYFLNTTGGVGVWGRAQS